MNLEVIPISKRIDNLQQQADQTQMETRSCNESIDELWVEIRRLEEQIQKQGKEMGRPRKERPQEDNNQAVPTAPPQRTENKADNRPDVTIRLPTNKDLLIKILQIFPENLTLTMDEHGLGISKTKGE